MFSVAVELSLSSHAIILSLPCSSFELIPLHVATTQECSVAVPPTLHVILTATPLFLLVAVAIGLEYNAAHSSVAGRLSR